MAVSSIKEYRAAIIGCGGIGSGRVDASCSHPWGVYTHAEAYVVEKRTRLVAVCDIDEEKARHCCQRWSVPSAYTDPIRLLAEQQPEIVSICTPDAAHYANVRAALLANGVKAVLAEKPLATRLDEARELVELAHSRGVLLAVNYSRRYSESYANVKSWLQAGSIGTIRAVRGLYTKGTSHNGTHWFDLARFLIGEVAAVTAVDRLCERGSDPTLDVRLELEDGTVADLSACSERDYAIFELELVGSLGRLRLLDTGNVIERYRVAENKPFEGYRGLELESRQEGAMCDLILHAVRNVVDCVESGAALRCSGHEGVRALQIALAAHESALTHSRVQLSNQ